MRARARLAAGALTSVALLGGTAACSGEAPENAEEGINEQIGDGEGEESGGDD